MPCRVGMTSNPAARKAYWKSQHPKMRNWDIIAKKLTYKEAHEKEKAAAKRYRCTAHSGGLKKRGKVYSVYRFDY